MNFTKLSYGGYGQSYVAII